MRIILSPAKKMRVDTDTLPWEGLPVFLEDAEILKEYLTGLSPEECRKLWNCSESIAELNYRRLREMDLRRNLTPALRYIISHFRRQVKKEPWSYVKI